MKNEESALILIDMQQGMRDPAAGERNNPDAEVNMQRLLAAWRKAGWPIVHVRHASSTPGSPFWPGQPGAEFQPEFAPAAGEHVVEKNVPDAFVRTGLERWLQIRGLRKVVVVGVSTSNSVESTVRSAGNLGFDTVVVSDATFTFAKKDHAGVSRTADEVHAMSLANLDGEYAAVMSTAEVALSIPHRAPRAKEEKKARVQMDFFFSYFSTYTYLSVMRIEKLSAEAGVTVRWRPFHLRTITTEQNNRPFVGKPVKMKYMWRDLERRAAQHGIDFNGIPPYPVDADLAHRVGTVAAMEGWCPEYSRALYRQWFLEHKPPGDPEQLCELVGSLGKNAQLVMSRAESDEVRDWLASETDSARSLGIFGSPTFAVDGEIFWGDDRLEIALDWCGSAHR